MICSFDNSFSYLLQKYFLLVVSEKSLAALAYDFHGGAFPESEQQQWRRLSLSATNLFSADQQFQGPPRAPTTPLSPILHIRHLSKQK